MPWDNHYPVFYSLIIGGFLLVGYLLNNLNLGVALYSLAQLLSMAWGLGFFLEWLQKKGVKKSIIYLSLCYFAAFPLFGNYAIVMWKDPWFSIDDGEDCLLAFRCIHAVRDAHIPLYTP